MVIISYAYRIFSSDVACWPRNRALAPNEPRGGLPAGRRCPELDGDPLAIIDLPGAIHGLSW